MTELPSSIRLINELGERDKRKIYLRLVPDWILDDFKLERAALEDDAFGLVSLICPKGSRAVEFSLRANAADRDPLLYMNIADTFNGQILVLLVIVNDPMSPRYHVDVDQFGNNTNFGTTSRNIPAEISAMKDGLAPGQIRRGLRGFRRSVPVFEAFVQQMGHDLFLIEPLAYHNAIVFERYGFNYSRGLRDMQEIDADFRIGGSLYNRLNGSNPFRMPEAHASIRGRSWAIHDGILGHPFTGFQMYKRIGVHANINTFPDAIW